MIENLRLIGVKIGMNGTALMEKMILGEITTQDLSQDQIKEVLAAWDTRNYVPVKLLDTVDKVQPAITKEEVERGDYSEQDYQKNYVENIEKYLKSIM